MPIIYVGAAAGTTSFTPPTHKVGDLFIAFAFRDGSTTNPTIGTAGWTTITNTTDGTSASVSAAWKVATTTAETSGTWTNASRIVCLIYRGHLSNGTPIGTFAPGAGTTDPVNYPARALTNSNVIGSSWFVGFAGHRSVDTNLQNPPSGMTLRQNDVDATCEVSAFDTNGPATANWPSTNVTVGGTASGWQSMVIEILAEQNKLNNYMFASNTPNSTGANPGVLAFGKP